MNRAFFRTGGILAAFIIGYFLPQLQALEWLIRWIIVLMLFTTFLKVNFLELRPQLRHLYLILANIGLAMGAWGAFKLLGHDDYATMAFFVAITPTATAAPVVMGFLKGRVEFMVASVITSTLVIGAALPILIPIAIGHSAPGLIFHIAGSLAIVLLLPLILATLIRNIHFPTATKLANGLGKYQFPLWVVNLTLVAASGSAFIRSHGEITGHIFLAIAALASGICFLNFFLGYQIGRPHLKRECSQSLGQKNTALTIYLALTYATPLAALSVTFYVVCHNTWNAIQIQRQGRKDKLAEKLIEKEVQTVYDNES